ncbi:MAG: XdhC family protein [Pseudomonadota bacterium]|nr:XdhC family protein [Pseudomonadota bacterium]
MLSTDITVLKQVHQWLTEGYSVWLTTVLKTYGSSPRQPGAMCAIREDGALIGSVSGGCIEDDLKDKVLAGLLADDEIVFFTYGESIIDRDRFRLPCGGTLRLAVEKITESDWLLKVLDAIEQRRQVTRRLQLSNRQSIVQPASSKDKTVEENSQQIAFVYGPRARLLLIGAGETSSYLAKMASALDYQVLVAEPREEMQLTWLPEDGELLAMMPDDAVVKIQPDLNTSIITLTHDPKLDDMALLEALKSEAFYIGALGSKRRNAKRRERLALFDLTPKQIARLHGPVGLDIGSKTPAEIAVAILAELIELKHARSQRHDNQADIRAVSNG